MNSVTVMTVVRAINDRGPRGDREDRPRRERRDVGDMQLYRIEVGRDDGVEVRHIVGAIANEGDISSRYIGNIKLFGFTPPSNGRRCAG
ncbi:DbpA RNA binding domain-containing protein [Escherichia coli]